MTRSEIQSDALTLFGYSLGGYLVARAAAFENRIHALILDDGFMSFTAAYESLLPTQLMDAIRARRDEEVNAAIRATSAADTTVRRATNNGMWVFGVASPVGYLRRVADQRLVGIADNIIAPTLIMKAENDLFFKGQPQALQGAMTAPTTLVALTEHDGAGEHCHVGATGYSHQVMFDWPAGVPARATA